MQRFYFLSLFLVCLILNSINAENDWKKEEFGEKFGDELKTLTLELGNNIITDSQTFYINLLKKSTTLKDNLNYTEALNKLRNIEQRLTRNDRQTIIEAFKELRNVEMRKIFVIDFESRAIKESDKFHDYRVAFETFQKDIKNTTDSYITGINQKWHEELAKIPADEQAKHEEYAEITELLEDMVGSGGRFNPFKKVMQKIFETFNYDQSWNVLLIDD